MKKLNELLEMNKRNIEKGLQTLKDLIENENTTRRKIEAVYAYKIQYHIDEVDEVKKAYKTLNYMNLLDNETYRKYNNEIKEFYLNVGKTLIEAQRIVESFEQ